MKIFVESFTRDRRRKPNKIWHGIKLDNNILVEFQTKNNESIKPFEVNEIPINEITYLQREKMKKGDEQ